MRRNKTIPENDNHPRLFTNRLIPVIIAFIFTGFIDLHFLNPRAAENNKSGYSALYEKGAYGEALKEITGKLNSYYKLKNDDRGFPDDYIFTNKEEHKKYITEILKKRKTQQFFIEDNKELFDLHLYAARCCFKMEENDAALNHYFQSMRYNVMEPQKDDYVFYEISQVYNSAGYFEAYLSSLEAAYSLNPLKYEYSLELGKALSITRETKKAIFHLQRYIEAKEAEIKDPEIYLTIGNLNEDTGNYLETVKYYKKYLEKKNNDGYILFALGHLSYKRTGDYNLALDCFSRSAKYLPENDLFRRSKIAEYQGDIYLSDLEYGKAIQFYVETKIYHDKIITELKDNNEKILKLDNDIRNIKADLDSRKVYERYESYEEMQKEKGRLELKNREMSYEFDKLNSGRIRWNIAVSYERLEKLEQAIEYYNEAIAYNYNSNEAREKIKKLKLKIIRGY